MFLALQMWRFDVFHLPLFFLMTGWTEWHFILFLTSTKTLCKKETMAGCKPQSIFRADTAQTPFEMYNYYEINILFLSDISADFFPPSESLMLFHFPLTKSKTSSWTLQRSSFRRFGNKQNVIWTHDQERQVSVSTSKQPPQSREGSTVSALLMTSSRREPTGHTDRHTALLEKWHYELHVESCKDVTLRFRLRQVTKKKHIHVFTCKFYSSWQT